MSSYAPERISVNSIGLKHALPLICLGLGAAGSAGAGELDGFDGRLRSSDDGASSYTWGLEYREPLTEHLNAGFTWLNEGHLTASHRDGQAIQLWWHSKSAPLGLVFEAGIGPYRYYETRTLNPDPAFLDVHGWGALASASVDWYFKNHFFTFLRVNQVEISDSYDTTALALGVGYRFASKPIFSADMGEVPVEGSTTRWEIDGFVGQRVGNTSHSETGLSEGLGARFSASEHIVASLTFIAGQGTLLDWHDGLAAQLWLDQRLTPRFSVGVGAGAFIVSEDNSLRDASSPSNLAIMVSVTVAYAITPRWIARAVWDRIGTGDDHDADILHLGGGYRF